jgi:hypothetical protein
LLPPLPPAHQVTAMGWKAVKEGLRFLRADRVLQSVYLIDLVAMVLGMPRALFPVFGTVLFHGGARTISYLYGCGCRRPRRSVGHRVGGSRQAPRSCRRDRRACMGRIDYRFRLGALAAGRSPVPGRGGLGRRGLGDFRNSILQLLVPDQLRGRMNAIQTAVVAGGPRLGDFESGAVATLVSPTFSVVSGGLASMAVAAIMTITMPVFWRLRLAPGVASEDPAAAPDVAPRAEPRGRAGRHLDPRLPPEGAVVGD